MLRIIIYALLAYLIYRLVKKVLLPEKRTMDQESGKVIDEMIQDPFCGKYIPRRESIKRNIKGKEYFFCSESCADQFEEKHMRD